MDPVTLALAVASLVAKAAGQFGAKLWEKFSDDVAEKAGQAAGDAGWSILGRMSVRLRRWFAGRNDQEGAAALDTVVAAPDSKMSVEKLAATLATALAEDPAFQQELQGYVDEAQHAPGEVGRFSVQVWGNAQVGKIQQFGSVSADTFYA